MTSSFGAKLFFANFRIVGLAGGAREEPLTPQQICKQRCGYCHGNNSMMLAKGMLWRDSGSAFTADGVC